MVSRNLSDTHTTVSQQITSLPRVGAAHRYLVLPARMAHLAKNPSCLLWRIELHGLMLGAAPIGLDICGDTVLGRGSEGPNGPDFDLDPYRALELGVSKRHAVLRPTHKYLYLIDLVSTNGTRCNAMPLGVGRPYPLKHNDSVCLGGLNFQVRIISAPCK